jgi:hypothetical protein
MIGVKNLARLGQIDLFFAENIPGQLDQLKVKGQVRAREIDDDSLAIAHRAAKLLPELGGGVEIVLADQPDHAEAIVLAFQLHPARLHARPSLPRPG